MKHPTDISICGMFRQIRVEPGTFARGGDALIPEFAVNTLAGSRISPLCLVAQEVLPAAQK